MSIAYEYLINSKISQALTFRFSLHHLKFRVLMKRKASEKPELVRFADVSWQQPLGPLVTMALQTQLVARKIYIEHKERAITWALLHYVV